MGNNKLITWVKTDIIYKKRIDPAIRPVIYPFFIQNIRFLICERQGGFCKMWV